MAMFASFVFCETTLKQINDLPENLRLKFYEAVTNYGMYGIEPNFSGLENTVWISMKDIIDTVKDKREKRKRAGKAGGEAKRGRAQEDGGENQDNDDVANPGKTDFATENPSKSDSATANPGKTDFAVANGNGNDNVNGNGNLNGNENGKEGGGFPFSGFPNSHFQTDPDLPPESDPPDQKAKSKEDATAVFQKARSFWNERKIPPECRDLIIPPSEYDCLRTFQNYAWSEIKNAIENYHWHFNNWKRRTDWKPPPGYKSLYGFLKNGVSQYCKDADFRKLFQEVKHGD
jgi:hypothetical protein